MQYKEYIDRALSGQTNSKDIENIFSKFYHFTTENIDGYFNGEYERENPKANEIPYYELDFKSKKILTVLSSGDHTLNAILKGCTDIDTFDINKFTLFYYNLKVAAIKILSLEEFKLFFYNDYPHNFLKNKLMFNIESYNKIREYLDNESKDFWDYVYLILPYKKIGTSGLFFKHDKPQSLLNRYNAYLNKENYMKLREILLNAKINFSFHNTNIKDIILKKKYDYIFLSNISQYAKNIYKKEYTKNWNELFLKLLDNLNDNGIITHSYIYNTDLDYSEEMDDIDSIMKEIPKLKVKHFEAFGNYNGEDAITYLKK